jgi:octaprenyl-diphosphate synthase
MNDQNGEPEKINDDKILELIQKVAEDVNASIKKQLEDDELAAVYELINYQQATGGKRLRPTLAVLIAQCYGGDYEQTIDMATTAELLHNASLVFDDVLDNDALRRGKPSAHTLYGAGTAMMGGNLLALMALKLGGRRGFPVLKSLVDAATCLALGATEEQLLHEYDELRYLRVISLKTASLFEAPCKIGAVMGDVMRNDYENARLYGWNIGMVYQLTDDLVDIMKTYISGKPFGHMKNGTPTLAFIHAFHHAKDDLALSLLEKFLKTPPLPMEEFNVLYHILEELGSIEYTLQKIEEHNKLCYKMCTSMPNCNGRNYLLAMPSFLHRVLMNEVKGHEGLEGMKTEEPPAKPEPQV